MSLVDALRAAGFELKSVGQLAAEDGYTGPNPHRCRGCGRWVDGKRLDAHERECSDPVGLRAYRRMKSEQTKRAIHIARHVRRSIIKPDCRLCQRDQKRLQTA